jgi:hypothetical protein
LELRLVQKAAIIGNFEFKAIVHSAVRLFEGLAVA